MDERITAGHYCFVRFLILKNQEDGDCWSYILYADKDLPLFSSEKKERKEKYMDVLPPPTATEAYLLIFQAFFVFVLFFV